MSSPPAAGAAGAGASAEEAAAAAAGEGTFSVLTWNVAGWRGTFFKLRQRHPSLGAWLQLLGCDVLCLQEVKMRANEFVGGGSDSTRFGAVTAGFEAFVACPREGKVTGVMTLARAGTVRGASRCLLPDGSRDESGRFLETDHGAFSVVNVYVPFDGEAHKNLPNKMNFLLAVQARMRRIRETRGHPVILAGDLNLTCRSLDTPVALRTLDLAKFSEPSAGLSSSLAMRLKAHLTSPGGMDRLKEGLGAVEPVLAKTKYHFWLRGARLDKLEPSESPSLHHFSLNRVTMPAVLPLPVAPDPVLAQAMDRSTSWVLKWENTIRVAPLLSVAQHVFSWASYPTDAEVDEFAEAGEREGWLLGSGTVCARAWAQSITRTDGMVDSFLEFHAQARNRFTVWVQATNDRYENQGTRIDFVFVDGSLRSRLVPPARPLYGCVCPSGSLHEPSGSCAWSCEAALRAATAHGDFSPAPLTGGGIPEPPKRAFDIVFRKPLQTEIVYTSPWYSDHVAVSCVLRGRPPVIPAVSCDAETMACRPHLVQQSIKRFFGAAAAAAASGGSASVLEGVEKEGDDEEECVVVSTTAATAPATVVSANGNGGTNAKTPALFPVFASASAAKKARPMSQS